METILRNINPKHFGKKIMIISTIDRLSIEGVLVRFKNGEGDYNNPILANFVCQKIDENGNPLGSPLKQKSRFAFSLSGLSRVIIN